MLLPHQVQGHISPSLLAAPAHRHSRGSQPVPITDAHKERSWHRDGNTEPVPAGRGLAGTAGRGAGPQEGFRCRWGSLLSHVCCSHGCASLWEGNCPCCRFPLPKATGQEQVLHRPTLGTGPARASLWGRALPCKTNPVNSITVALPKLPRTLPGLLVLPGAGQATVPTRQALGSKHL